MSSGKRVSKEKYDVVIVGSGPAGASTAKALTGRSLRVMIVEMKKLPRYKMCTGLLVPTAVKFISENFGDIPDKAYSDPMDIMGLRAYLTMDSPVTELPFRLFSDKPDLPTKGVSAKRPELDYWLCSCSDAAIVDQCKFVDCRKQNNEIMIKLEINKEVIEVATNYLVGADGTLSRVRKVLSPDFDRGIGLISNYEEWYLGKIDLEPGWVYCFYDRKLTGFYACLFQKNNQIIAVTGVKQQESVKEFFQEYLKYLKRKHGLIVREKVASHGCVIHDMSATNNFYMGEGNVLLAGEAAGFNRCSEGITPALITGRAAGESVLKSIESGQPAFEFYSRVVLSEIKACTKASRLMEQKLGINVFTRD